MRTSLYRHFDSRGHLLYVGISLSAVQRLSEHAKGAKWAADITHVTVEFFDSRDEALQAEKAAIEAEQPVHNIVHNAARKRGQRSKIAPHRAPVVPQFVEQPEAVAVHFRVNLKTVQQMIRDGMPRERIDGRSYRYDIAAIMHWTKQRSLEEEAKNTAARMDAMQAAMKNAFEPAAAS